MLKAVSDDGAGGGGGVVSVSGTANRITVASGTTNAVVDISSSYVGQASITTVGTLTNLTVTNPITGSVTGSSGTVATISGLIAQGTNVTITGSGTSGSPYIITSSSTASTAFSALTGSTNTTAAMVVGSGASLGPSGTGTIISTGLKSASTAIDVSASTAPSTGQVLTATDSTHATWQAPGSGSGISTGFGYALASGNLVF